MIVSVRVGCHGFWNVKPATDPRGVGLEISDPRPTAGDVGSGGGGSNSGGLGGLGGWPGGLDSPTVNAQETEIVKYSLSLSHFSHKRVIHLIAAHS